MGEYAARFGRHKKCIHYFGWKNWRKIQLVRSRHKWKDIRMDHREIVWKGMNWIHLAQDIDQRRDLVNTVVNPRVPQKAGNFLTSWALGYGLVDRGSRVRFSAGAGNFSLHHRVHNGSGAHRASYPMGTRGSFPGSKAAGAWSWQLTSI
jgi:hypothetical protein